ncbi:hypothetical protein VDGL01_02214 [Verticillium dahliae]
MWAGPPKQNHQVPGDPASAFRGPPAIPNASERASRAEETRDRPKAASPICAQLGAIRATPVAPGKRSSFGSCVPELQGAETTPSSRIWVLPRSLNVLAYAPDTAVDRAIHLIFATVCWSRRQRNKYLDLFFRYLLLGLVLRASLVSRRLCTSRPEAGYSRNSKADNAARTTHATLGSKEKLSKQEDTREAALQPPPSPYRSIRHAPPSAAAQQHRATGDRRLGYLQAQARQGFCRLTHHFWLLGVFTKASIPPPISVRLYHHHSSLLFFPF